MRLLSLRQSEKTLRGTGYNTRDERIRAIGRSIWNINNDGRSDGVRRLPKIWEMVMNKGATILKVHKCCTLVNKAMSQISNFCHYFFPTLVLQCNVYSVDYVTEGLSTFSMKILTCNTKDRFWVHFLFKIHSMGFP